MTTTEAFTQLMKVRAWYKIVEINPNTALTIRYNFKQKKLSINKMEEILLKAGYSKKPESWTK